MTESTAASRWALAMFTLVLALAHSSMVAEASFTPNVCLSGFNYTNGRCFRYVSTPLAYSATEDACKESDPADRTLHVADPRTAVENTLVSDLGCASNNEPFTSAWNVWLGDTDAKMNYVNTDVAASFDKPYDDTFFVCVCPVPSNPRPNLCIDKSPDNVRPGAPLVSTSTCTNPPSTRPTSCGSRNACRRAPTAVVGVSNPGRGMCWLGGGRSTQNSAGTILWDVSMPGVSNELVPLNRLESNLFATSSQTSNQAQYTKTQTYGYATIKSTPNCVAMWNYNTANWVMEYCNRPLPFVCVMDARCPAGYYKSASYSVSTGGTVSSGTCTKCAAGKYRAFSDEQSPCIDCLPGYFGNGTIPATGPTCNGVCPAGTFCPGATQTPIKCNIGYYGRPLVNVTGPGYTSFQTACAPCPAGSYCDVAGGLLTDRKNCAPGFCGFEQQTGSSCSRTCVPGYYCPVGEGSACPGRPCGDGQLGNPAGAKVYCPDGSRTPVLVPTGHYGLGGSSSLTNSAVAECPPGFYCLDGVRTPCGNGTYSSTDIAIAQRTSCKPCRSGYYCPGPVAPDVPTSTSPTQEFCAPAGYAYPAEFYCINGTRYKINPPNAFMTIPTNVALNIRENAVACPADKVCDHGIAYDRLEWFSCPNGKTTVTVPELWAVPDTPNVINASLYQSLNASDYFLDYRVLNQSFYNPAALLQSTDTACKAGQTVNDGIFSIDPSTGRLRVTRFSPDPFNPAGALQFEACAPLTDIRYVVMVQASARQKVGTIQANITCAVTVVVSDANDVPVFHSLLFNRVIPESAADDAPATRCNGVASTTGCPNDATPNADPAVSGTDEDTFGLGNVNYSFVGPLTEIQKKLKINSCTGLISQNRGSENVIRFSDPALITVPSTNFKRLEYTVQVEDDGNGGTFSKRSSVTTVHVYIQNINDRPVFITPSTVDIWIPESTSARKYPAGALTSPSTFNVQDEDPGDVVTLSIARNDAGAFEMVNGVLRTTVTGESVIDYESSKKVYSIDIEARDNGVPSLAALLTVNIRVANVNDPPIIENNLVFYIPENAGDNQAVCRDDTGLCSIPDPFHAIKATDPDNIATDKTTYSLTLNPGNLFQINTTSGQVSLKNKNTLNFENEGLKMATGTGRGYTLQVRATSSGVGVVTQSGVIESEETDTRNFTVFIVDVNENPTFVTPNTTEFRVVETWPVGRALFNVQIRASDPDNADLLLFDVKAPTQELTFSLSDDHSGEFDGSEFFSVSTDPTDNSLARIVVKKPLDYETAPDCPGATKCYTLRIRVSDNGGPIQGVAENVYTITLVNVNEVPVFSRPNGYSLTAAEDLAYGPTALLTSATPLIAYDNDQNGNASLVYAVLGGDGFDQFGIQSLGAGNGFSVSKQSNILLNYELKATYSLRVQVTDTGGGSSAIGKACTLDQGVSVGCGNGAFCNNSQCYETCRPFSNSTTTISAAQVPRKDVFFCRDLSGGPDSLVPVGLPFRETAEVTITISLTDANDPPFIVDRPLTVPQPDILTNALCSLWGVISNNRIGSFDQFPFTGIPVWDDDPNPGIFAGPFTFTTIPGPFWSHFQLSNATTGIVKFPICTDPVACSQYVPGNLYNGHIQVEDRSGKNSVCSITVNITEANVPPNLGSDFPLPPVLETALEGSIIMEGFTQQKIAIFDSDTTAHPPDRLTFSTTFSAFFDVDPTNGTIRLKQPLDYESLHPTYTRTILLRAVDSFGADDVVQITVPVADVNEPPFWTAPVSSNGRLELQVLENTAPLTSIVGLEQYIDDPDKYAVNPSWKTLSIAIVPATCNSSCPFQITNNNITVKSGASLDFEGPQNSWSITVRVTDGPGLFSDLVVVISLRNENERPTFTGTTTITVPEGNGGPSGLDLLDMTNFVNDPDANDPVSSLTYNITSGNINNVFRITSLGRLGIAPNRVLDYEDIRLYTLNLTVRDTNGSENTGSFNITVSNVNDVTVSSITVDSGPNAASQQLACNGTASRIKITGTNFGLISRSPAAVVTLRYRRSVVSGPVAPVFNSTACAVTVSNTVIECNVTKGGAGIGLLWDVLITVPTTTINGDAVTNFATAIAFPAPSIDSVGGANLMSTSGGQTVSLSGTCLGTPSDSLGFAAINSDSFVELCTEFDGVCRAMSSGCAATSALGTTIVCTSATLPGLGARTSFKTRVGRSNSNAHTEGGYGLPTISAVSTSVLRTSGVIPVPGLVINGTNYGGLGTAPSKAKLYYRDENGTTLATYDLLNCAVTIAYKQVTCTSHSPGIGSRVFIELEFGLQVNTASPMLRFESPVVLTVATDGNALSSTVGGIFVTLTGTSFGPVCGVPGTSLASGAVNCNLIQASYSRGSVSTVTGQKIVYRPIFCATISQAQIVCTTVEGTGRDHSWNVTVGGQDAFVSPTAGKTGYSSPVVGAYAGPGSQDALTAGSQYIDLQGAHFGPVGGAPVSAQYGNELHPTEFTAVNCTVTIAHVEMRCLTGVGAGNALSWKVTVDQQLSRAQLSDYGPPVISAVSPSTNLRDDGSQTVTITGNNFGPPGATNFLESVTYGPPTFQSLFDVTSRCTVTSHESFECLTLPGLGQNLKWRVRIRGQASPVSTATTSFALPTLTSISNTTGKTNGAVAIRLTGTSFGLCDSNSKVRVAFGETLVDVQSVFRVGSPDPINLAAACNPGLPSNFGTDRILSFMLPEMTASNVIPVSVQVDSIVFPGGRYRTAQSFTFTYGNPIVTDVFAEPGKVPGEISVTLSGSNFCRSEACCQTYLDGSIASSRVTIHTHDRITFSADAPGATFVRCPGGDTPVQVFSSQNPYVYGAVRVSDFARLDTVTFATQGKELIYVFSLFAGTSSTLDIGGRPANITQITTFNCDDTSPGFMPDTIDAVQAIIVPNQVCTRILAEVPAGQGTQNEIVVTVGALRSRADDFRFEFLKYTAPSITDVSATFAQQYTTQGNNTALLTVTGNNFGLTGELLFGPTSYHNSRNKIACTSSSPGFTWSHNSVSCFVPAGEGSALDIRVIAGGQLSPAATGHKLQYQRPTITSFAVPGGLNDSFADTIGGQTLVITGTNFGRFFNGTSIADSPGLQPAVSLGVSLVCAIQQSIHTEIRCTIPPGEGKDYLLSVVIAGELPATQASKRFSYAPPQVLALFPTQGRTDGKDAQGNRQVFQIIGNNFGLDQLRVEFGTVNGKVLLGRRSTKDLIDDFLYPGTNHTSIRVYLPSYFGSNLTVIVTVNGQSSNSNSSSSPMFSYAAPIIGNVTSSIGGRQLQSSGFFIHNADWISGNGSSASFGECLPVRSISDSSVGVTVSVVYQEKLEILPGGTFTRTYQFFSLPSYTTLSPTTSCSDSSLFLGESVQTGTFDDLGENPDVGCMRAYSQVTSTLTGFPVDSALFPNGGFGYYLISERKNLYIGAPMFPSLETLRANPHTAALTASEAPSATLRFGLPPQNLTLIPTSGCYGWESEVLYRTRIQNDFLAGGPTVPPRKCLFPALISVTGANFGSGAIAPQGALRVYLVDDRGVEFEASTTSSGGNHEIVCGTELGCVHSDTLIVFQAPFGSGRGLKIRVVVGNVDTISEPRVDFQGPDQSELSPGTLNAGANFLAASGKETIRVIGENLGYTTSSLSVLVNGRPCGNSSWVTGFNERLGRSSIQCETPPDVSGLKSIFVCVGGQGKMSVVKDSQDDIAALQYGQDRLSWNSSRAPNLTSAAITVRALAVSRCPTNTYGRLGELCLPCPQGARCDPGFSAPIPQDTFALITMASDSKRALEGSCAKERIDKSFAAKYPDIALYETCDQIVRCIPQEACLGANTCAEGYEYQLLRCRAKRASNDSEISNSCRVYFDHGVGVYRGVDSDCQRNTEPGKVCSFEHPEDCAQCKVVFATSDPASAFGTCDCVPSQRCALCTSGTHYRLNNECIKCPDNPALVFALFILAGISCIGLAYYLQKRKINLAFISVGVDYFQVLAVLSTTNVPWPPVIRAIFTIFTLFLASIDITAPECLVPNLEFPTKFYMTELLPLLALVILLSIHTGYSMYKVYKLGKQAKWLSHVSRLIGIYVLIIYVLYLSLTKKALDVFNCNPLDPDDGYAYTSFSSLSCDGGGLCRCYEEGGLQDSLVAPAIIFLAIYTFGFPFFVGYIVFSRREHIREDQYLRANHLGDRRETNPRAYDTRKRFQLMYMHFKPKYSFWMLAILGRKFGVAFASLMFRGNPSFQLAVILVVLFVSFTLQVSLKPYMSPGEFPVVVKELNDSSKKADEDPETYALYRDLYRKVGESMKTQAELIRKEKMQRHKMGAGFWEESKQAAREHDRRSAAEKYFFDLNAVEAVLLGATIIISLAGIMFESGRFQTTREDIQWQGDLVVVLVFIVLFGSLGYYVLVFVNELWPVFFARWCGRCFLKYQNDGVTNEELEKMKDNDIVLDANPLFAASGPVGDKSKTIQKEIEASKEALALAKRQNDELKRLKAELEGSGGMTAQNPLALRELMNTGGINEKH